MLTPEILKLAFSEPDDILSYYQDIIECSGTTCILWNKDKTKRLGTHTGKTQKKAKKRAIAQELAIRLNKRSQVNN